MDVTKQDTRSFLIDELASYREVILANGTFPYHQYPLHLLRQARHLICCDGAVDKLDAACFVPTVVVGDCDSQNSASLPKWKSLLEIDKSEEYNDLQKALKYCLRQKYDKVALVGCDGLRDDHFLANISIMLHYSTQIPLIMVTNYGIFNVLHQSMELRSYAGEQVSVFSTDPQLRMTFDGLKYPVSNRAFAHLWEGSLNEAVADSFYIELFSHGAVMVYRAF